ncbi:tetratricopeptide repeat protein [Kitasatospora sp. NPDC093550]|uniref:tetratricopeptide repeat protein n=1 Tax=Kitasatospora sp. NPDC093550 TaxID=3364089 RepID=UPI0037FDF6A8
MQNSIRGGTFHGPVVQADTAHVTVSATPPTIGGLPPLSSVFTGRRQDLTDLATLLAPEGPPVVAVTGLGGIGKTTLAVAAGHALLAAGHCALALLVDLRGYDETPVEAGQALDTLLRALGVPAEHIPPDPETRAALYRDQLERHGRGVLVIADNASAAEQVRLLRPPSGRHRLLVTTRETLPSLEARIHRLGVLAPDEAVALLDTSVRAARPDDDRVAADPDQARRIAELCGSLPLALRLAAAQLVLDPHLRPEELADDLADGADRLDLLHDGETGMRLTLDRSYRRLTPDLAELFRLLALNPGPDLATEAAAELLGRKPREARSLLARLAGTALIEQSAEGGRWYLYDLVRDYAADMLEQHPDGVGAALGRLLDHYTRMARLADARVRDLPFRTDEDGFGDRTEALLWLERERLNLIAVVQGAADAGLPELAVHLSSVVAPQLVRGFRTDDALTVTSAALAAAVLLGDTEVHARALGSHGVSLERARRFVEAAEAHRLVAAIHQDLGDPLAEADALMNLGNALRGTRDFDAAIEAQRRALDIVRRLGGPSAQARALINLGGLLTEVRRLDEAVELLRAGQEIFAELGDRHGEATAWASAGTVLDQLGSFEESIDAHRRALDAFRDVGDRHSEAKALGGLGTALVGARRYEEAVEAAGTACAVFRELDDPHDEALTRWALGSALTALGRSEEALASHRRELTIHRELGDPRGRAESGTRLANLLQELGRHDEAEAAHREALTACREAGDRVSEAIVLTNLGNCLGAAGRFEEALGVYRTALAIDGDPDAVDRAAMILYRTAAAHAGLGQEEQGIEALHRATDLHGESGNDEGVALVQTYLGHLLTEVGRPDEAAGAARRAVAVFRRTGGRDGEAAAWSVLGDALRAAGAEAGAEEAYGRERAILAELEPEPEMEPEVEPEMESGPGPGPESVPGPGPGPGPWSRPGVPVE